MDIVLIITIIFANVVVPILLCFYIAKKNKLSPCYFLAGFMHIFGIIMVASIALRKKVRHDREDAFLDRLALLIETLIIIPELATGAAYLLIVTGLVFFISIGASLFTDKIPVEFNGRPADFSEKLLSLIIPISFIMVSGFYLFRVQFSFYVKKA